MKYNFSIDYKLNKLAYAGVLRKQMGKGSLTIYKSLYSIVVPKKQTADTAD